MDDHDIEKLLRRYAPAGPPPSLRARIVRPAPSERVWPWAAAASLLLAATVALRMMTASVAADVAIDPAPDTSQRAVAELTEMLGGDDAARRYAEAAIARIRNQIARMPDAGRLANDEGELR